MQPAVAESVMLKDLTIELEEFKANILNAKVAQVELSGQVHVSGPANPHKMHIEGTIKLGRGEVCCSPSY